MRQLYTYRGIEIIECCLMVNRVHGHIIIVKSTCLTGRHDYYILCIFLNCNYCKNNIVGYVINLSKSVAS